jgi:hypothetical protein
LEVFFGANGRENLSTTSILLKARNNKTISFIDKKKSGSMQRYSFFYDMNLDFKTVQLGYTGTAVLLEERD